MATYRLYYFLGDKIEGTDVLEAKNDDEAIVLGRARKLSVACEIWDRDRLVARLPAHE